MSATPEDNEPITPISGRGAHLDRFDGRSALAVAGSTPGAGRTCTREGAFDYAGFRLCYTEYYPDQAASSQAASSQAASSEIPSGHSSSPPGGEDRVVVLLHGLLMTRRMHRPLARALAREGFRVLTLDLLGHGESDRPPQSWRYSMPDYADQVVALLDHLGAGEAIVGGTSLGANVALEVGAAAPQRALGLIIEMPVLDNALLPGLMAFPPLLFAARFAPAVVRGVAAVAARVPRGHLWVDVLTDTLRQHPAAMAAVLHGVLFGRIAPPKSLRRRITTPAVVLGHSGDPVHPFGDADTLAEDMPAAAFVRARSPLELRFDPERLTRVILEFAERCYETPRCDIEGARRSV